MSVNSNALERRLKKRASLTDTNLLLIITIIVFIVMYLCAVVFLKKGFTKPQMFFNILNENASLLVLSCGMTLVMITGGIDISVGQVTCLVCMACAVHLQKVNDGVINGSVFTSLLIAIAIGLAFGIVQGFLVAYMEFQPFIVTLAGLFFAKGMTTIVCSDRVPVTYEPFVKLARTEVTIPFLGSVNKKGIYIPAYVEIGVIVAIVVVILLFCLLK